MADEDQIADAEAARTAEAETGMQSQHIGADEAADALPEVADDGKPDPGPTTKGLATPMHVEPPADVMAARLAPDAGADRVVLTTTPVIGGVEGNIPMPDTSNLVGFPWPQMGVGDSFEVGHGMTVETLERAAKEWADLVGSAIEFKAHLMSNGIRIWRTV